MPVLCKTGDGSREIGISLTTPGQMRLDLILTAGRHHTPDARLPTTKESCSRLLLFLLLLPLLVAPSAHSAPEVFRIATFNVKWLTESATETRMAPWEDEEHLAEHRRNLALVIAKIHPDILCVQEATTRGALEKLAAEPALKPLRYRVLHIESEDTGTGQDVAFLVGPRVRLDTIQGAAIRRFADTLQGRPADMHRNDPRRQRLTKHALVCVSRPEKICLLGLHLLAHPDDKGRTAKRETQTHIAAHIVRTEIVARGYAPVVLGDFNDFDPDVGGPSSYAVKKRNVLRVIKDFDTTRPGPELINVAGRISLSAKRYSAYWDRNMNGVRDARDPISLLDHILMDKRLEKRIVKVEIRHDLHDGQLSDHWPVVVDLGN
jgi:endonuclease/exonuclease/phosphatase family metal-dependent hydrolase